jgi:cobalt-zinc-cadmium efflux system outer membrane protein
MSRSLARRGLLGVLVVSLWCPAIIARAQDAVSLERVLAHADAHAPLILAARARLEEGGAARRGADRLLTDPLSVELGGGPRIADGTGSDFDMVVALTQPIEVAGERGLRIEAADRLSARRGAELEVVRWQIHREIHFAYHQAIEARARLEAQREWLAFTERLLDIARARVSAGDVGPLELAIAEAELAGARQRLVEAEARALDTRLAMAELAGWPASSPPTPLGDLDARSTMPGIEELLARATAEHPVLRALGAAVEEQRALAALADREAAPTLDVGLTFAREGSAGSPANYIGMLVLGAAIPFWNANATEREAARARISVAEAELDALRSAVEARVRRAAASVLATAERVRIFQEGVLPSFERNLALLHHAFELGELDALEVGTATRRLLEVQANALDAFAEYHRALASLEAEVGAEVITDEAHGPREPHDETRESAEGSER